MRTSFFALALLIAAPAFAAPAGALAPHAPGAVAADAAPVAVRVSASAQLVIHTPMVVSATITLRDAWGHEVRAPQSRLLWDGETTLDLGLEGLPAGTYTLVVESRLGTQSVEFEIA